MLRILHVTSLAERGGVEVILLNILKALDRSRFDPFVLCLENGPFVAEVASTNTPIRVIEAGRVREMFRGAGTIAAVVRLVREERIDIVHSHNAKAHIYGGLAALLAGVPSVFHLHGVPRLTFSRDGLVNLVSVAIPAAQTIACSRYVAEAFTTAWWPHREVMVVRNGVVPEGSGVSNHHVEFGIPPDAPLVIMVSRLQRWKGVHIFVEAVAQVARLRQDARFLVVGGSLFGLEREYARYLRRLADQLVVARVLQFTGHRTDVWRFYKAADIVIHSSIEPDPFPTVLLEAMAAGKPVIASEDGGPSEIVANGVTGVLVRPARPDLLAQRLLVLLADRRQRDEMGDAAVARFQSEFHATRMVRQLQTVYEQLAGGVARCG